MPHLRRKHIPDQDINWLLVLETACNTGLLLFSMVLTFSDSSFKSFLAA
jgi:hypothetical protein